MSSLDVEGMLEELKKYPSYFQDEAMKHLLTEDIIHKKIGTLQSARENEPIYFEYNPSTFNALSFYLFLDGEYCEEALKLNNYVQNKWPTNIMAKINAVNMHIQREEWAKARAQFKYLKTFVSEQAATGILDKEIILGKAEIALQFQSMSIKGYPIAFELYQAFLDTFFIKTENDMLVRKQHPQIHLEPCELTWWSQHVLRLYNVMLNRGNLEWFHRGFKQTFNIGQHFRDIYQLGYIIIDAESQTETMFSGCAYVELADAVPKVTQIHKVRIPRYLFGDISQSKYMEKALKCTPNDAYVLERVGRYYKKNANSREYLLKAIRLLQRCVDCNPKLHIAWHHLGMSYRILWIVDSGCPESVAYLKKRSCKIFKFLLGINPKANPSSDNTSLQKAKECLEKACNVTKDTSLIYLIDLGRIHMSLNEPKLAEKVFMKGKQRPWLSSNHQQYLYEQWVLCKLSHNGEDGEQLTEVWEDAKDLYKMFIRQDAQNNFKSQVLSFELKDSLDEYTEQENDPGVRYQLLKDKTYLQKLVDHYDKAITSLVTWLEDDPDDIDFVWDMVAIYNKQEIYVEAHKWLEKAMKHQDILKPHQRKLAIEITTRLANISSSRSKTVPLDNLFSMLHLQTQWSCLQGQVGTLSICDDDNGIVDDESQKSSVCTGRVVKHDILYKDLSAQITADLGYHILIIGYNRFDAVIQFAEKALKKVGLYIFTHTTDNHSDVPKDIQPAPYVKKVLERCMSVVIHPEVNDEDIDEVDNSEWREVVDEAIRTHPSHACYLVSGRTCINVLHKSLPSVDMTKYPRYGIHQPGVIAGFVEDVIKCIFL